MRRLPLLFGLILFVIQLTSFRASIAQGNGLMRTDLISPSPTAAALSKYGDIPVNYYTGLPNVSIPIFNVTGNQLSIPISLSYNYSGAQPTQQAGWVGLGWSLQAGGVITRSIGDKIDPTGGYDRDSASRINPPAKYLSDSYAGVYDNLPDIYSFNFGNYSGKFIWYGGQAYVMPDQKIKVEVAAGGWKITVEDGTVYQFTEDEKTSLKPGAGSLYSLPEYVSSWYLTRVTNANNTESITLTYEAEGTVQQFGPRVHSYNQFITSPVALEGYKHDPSPPGPPSDVYPTRVKTKRLQSISSDKFIVSFDADTISRTDLLMDNGSCKKLGRIRIVSNTGVVKYVKFNYGYFGASAGMKFLRLESVVDEGMTEGAQYQKHSFEYYAPTAHFGLGSIAEADKFGYLMGAGEMSIMYFQTEDEYLNGAGRDPNFSVMIQGTLKKITYPTGGSTEFLYEPNRFKLNSDTDQYETITFNSGGIDWQNNHSIRDGRFSLSADTYTRLKIFRTPEFPSDPFPGVNSDDYEIWERYFDGNGVEHLGAKITRGALAQIDNNYKEVTVYLPSGLYLIRALADSYEEKVEIAMEWDFVTTTPKPGRLGPGIRLGSLIHQNGFGKTITKNLKYVTSSGFTSGVLLQSYCYSRRDFSEEFYSTQLLGAVIWQNDYISHTSVLAEIPGIGLPFYYKRVEEETVSGSERHKSVHEFDYFSGTQNVELIAKTDYKQSDDTFVLQNKAENFYSPEYPAESFAGIDVYVRGTKICHEAPSINSSFFDFVSKAYTQYWKYPSKTRQTTYENGLAQITENISYYDVSGTKNLLATKQINSDGSSIYTKYKYPEDYVSGVTSDLITKHILSVPIEEQVWRKQNGATDSVLINGKINEYYQGLVKAIHVMESGTAINSLNAESKANGKYQNLISDSHYQKKIEFKYSASGRIVEQQLTGHPPVSYIWDHPALTQYSLSQASGGSLPIAQIQNAKADSAFYTSFETNGVNTVPAVSGRLVKADTFKIKKTFNGKYKLTYWKKTGSASWQLVEQTLTNPSNYVVGAIGSFIDEVRLFPIAAQMTTYTYFGNSISSVSDLNSNVMSYHFDEMGRLKNIKDSKGSITKAYQYHVKDQVIPNLVE